MKDENRTIGTVDKIYPVGTRFALAGLSWETVDVNERAKVLFVKRVQGISAVDWDQDFEVDLHTALVVVPTSFNTVTEDEWKERGVNVVIYANHLIRSGYPAMQKTAETILRCRRAKEADEAYCMPINEILTLIPED